MHRYCETDGYAESLAELRKRYGKVGIEQWLCQKNPATEGRPPYDYFARGRGVEVAAIAAALPMPLWPPWRPTATAKAPFSDEPELQAERAAQIARNRAITITWGTRKRVKKREVGQETKSDNSGTSGHHIHATATTREPSQTQGPDLGGPETNPDQGRAAALPAAPPTMFEEMWLPKWPLSTDDTADGVFRVHRDQALRCRIVEANPAALSNFLVVDIDHGDSTLRAASVRPVPNFITENPVNGHAHAVWALKEPFARTELARRGPIVFAAAVTEGLRRVCGGDPGYGGLLTKNPDHDYWNTLWLTEDCRDLGELAESLGPAMPERGWRKKPGYAPAGLGRNCALFESSRHWAYREMRRFFGDAAGLALAIETEVLIRNSEFADPLPVAEARAIAASITKWITTKSDMWVDGAAVYEAKFSTIQAARGRRNAGKSKPGLRKLTDDAAASLIAQGE